MISYITITIVWCLKLGLQRPKKVKHIKLQTADNQMTRSCVICLLLVFVVGKLHTVGVKLRGLKELGNLSDFHAIVIADEVCCNVLVFMASYLSWD